VSSDPRQKAKDLIELAADKRTPEKERVSASVHAVALIHKHDLLTLPESPLNGLFDNEIVQEVSELARIGKKLADRVGRARKRR
jgi:hypothetical protein